ncbi:MAG: hypothetical protein A3C38_06440 [Planctomycetes bacterium RIFCSPHIGHO2_02_FULL_50_42]|nr:MAG: hypothetical protein A3C38_06440 [Planctomycetes bacterium RIFCSPHIGHO2_02_FULL_50_42]OHB91523.1 MAG: hypothetical protein A3E75_03055 [Planctomycetes bacterium RIFCSPHIGHO2_12_FULL_51_37]OHB96484.1 MAG: hypothetical protein A3I59_08455 [Planctomycetes bacterium RIFCSPLOWO2_02_FULL_50_16]OHC03178.1 MAG: hypothetical protein A3G17_04685 [Planctomycetes bacterium RIFCSPLOWO2_12_FULL_50_35]
MNGLSFPIAILGYNVTHAKAPVELGYEPDIWHAGPVGGFLLAVLILVTAGEIGRNASRLLNFPEALGELMMGIILGNIYFFSGWGFFELLHTTPNIAVPADFGAIILLLSVGLRTDIHELFHTGPSPLLVAIGGIVATGGLGYLVGHFLLSDVSLNTRIFLIIIICATSIAVTVRVFEDMGRLQSDEARVVIGAATISDVLIFLTFGIANEMRDTEKFVAANMAVSAGILVGIIAAKIVIGMKFGKNLENAVNRKLSETMKVFIVVVTCLLLAYLAESAGLAAIAGSFGAGLLLRSVYLKDMDGEEYGLEEIVRPAYMIFVPIFFVYMGTKVGLEAFLSWNSAVIVISITAAAMLGKLFCGLCVVEKGVNRLVVGIGMMPRAEVTVALAGIGINMGVLSEYLFSAIIMVVVIVILVTPLLLRLVLSERQRVVEAGGPMPAYVSGETRKVNLKLKRLGRR